MVTPRVRSVDVATAATPTPAPPRTGDVIVVVGPAETDPSNPAIGGPYHSAADAATISGNTGLLHDAIEQIFSHGRPDVYAVAVGGTSGDTVPTEVQLQGGLDAIEVPNPTVIYAPGATSGSTGTATGQDANATAVKAKAAELGCVALLDGPYGAAVTIAERRTWSLANLSGGRAMGFGPSSNADKPIGGHFLGVWDAGVAANGRGSAGSPHGRVIPNLSAAGLSDRIVRNPRVTSGTNEAALVTAGMAVAAVRADGAVVISMSDFAGVAEADAILRFWTVRLAVDHLTQVLSESLDRLRNAGPAVGRLDWVANQLQLAARPLVQDGEFASVIVSQDAVYNTPAIIIAGNPRFIADVRAPVPIVGPSIRVAVGGAT